MKRITAILSIIISANALFGAIPGSVLYNSTQCEGSAMPYPIPQESVSYPDSLTPVMINHVGRHGARYPASAARPLAIKRALQHADSLGTITPLGKELLTVTENVIERSNGKWGALDSLGIAEQRGIASRMFANYPNLFANGKVTALSSYAPRCIMSMYSFTHQLARMNNRLEIFTSSGRQNSPLMRPFDLDQDYIDYREDKPYDDALKAYIAETAPTAPIKRVLGDDYPLNEEQMRDLAITEYGLLAGLSAMGYNVDVMRFLTIEEYNSLWSCNNLKQYLERTANTISTVPADITADLLMNLITTTDEVAERRSDMRVQLRFGHAETLMPLLSLMHLDGCYYMTNYFDTVGLHWRDFYVVPMASNLQIVLFKAKSGKMYVRADLNETPVPLIPGNDNVYVEWTRARDYLLRCLPLYLQP